MERLKITVQEDEHVIARVDNSGRLHINIESSVPSSKRLSATVTVYAQDGETVTSAVRVQGVATVGQTEGNERVTVGIRLRDILDAMIAQQKEQ